MRTTLFVLALLTLLAPAFADPKQPSVEAGEASPAEWMVVTAPGFRGSLAALIERRRAEGLRVSLVETTNVLTPEQIRSGDGWPLAAFIKQQFGKNTKHGCVLLVGALNASKVSMAEQTVVPGLPGMTGRMKGLAGDYGYSLPDEEGIPRIAVGRFPGRTAEEVRSMVEKTLRLEQDCPPGPWRNRITLLQGNPGGGPLAEMFVEQATLPRLQGLHPAWHLEAIADFSASPYFLPASHLREGALDELQSGELFSIYLGHSDASGLWSNGAYLLSREDWARLNLRPCQGVFFTCGCFACQWSGDHGEGYGLAAMRNARGPAAVIGASAESYSAPGLLAIDGFLQCCSQPPFPSRLADYWLAVQSGLAKGTIDEGAFSLFDQFDGSGGRVPLSVQRREHLEMWMLLGDPALRLPILPLDIALSPPASASPGSTVVVRGTLPERLKGARVHLSIDRPVGFKPTDLDTLPDASPEKAATRERTVLANHRKANQTVLAEADAKSSQTGFECALTLPASIPWPRLVVRAYATRGSDVALGVEILPVKP